MAAIYQRRRYTEVRAVGRQRPALQFTAARSRSRGFATTQSRCVARRDAAQSTTAYSGARCRNLQLVTAFRGEDPDLRSKYFDAANPGALDRSWSGCPVPADIWPLLQISFRIRRPATDQIQRQIACCPLTQPRMALAMDNPFCSAHESSPQDRRALQNSRRARRSTLEICEQGNPQLRITGSTPARLMQSRHPKHVD